MNESLSRIIPSPGEPPDGEISPKLTSTIEIFHDLRVPMRDGTRLSLDLVRPDLDRCLPVVLIRTPYDKTAVRSGAAEMLNQLTQRGYAVAINDCRGRFNSDGDFFPYMNEADDGFDTVEWVAEQSWCDGNIGMLGGSYVGQTQWYAASRVPPHLKAIVPMVSPPSSLWRNEPVINGIFLLGFAEWMVHMGRHSWQMTDATSRALPARNDYLGVLPVSAVDQAAGVDSYWWQEMLNHPTYDDFWKRGSYGNYEEMQVAVLNVTGWWDLNFPGAPENFERMRSVGKTPEVRAGQKLVIGPWPHHVNRPSNQLNGVDFGEHSVIELDRYVIRFLDRYLKNMPNGIENEKPVYVFITGANEWWAEDDWPLPDTHELRYYMHSEGRANSLKGDGTLSPEAPDRIEPPDSYIYDPSDVATIPLPDVSSDGPVDDRLVSLRDDVLCYTSEPLTENLDVVGWVTCRLYASSSAVDTDWHARLVDVERDGTTRFLCRGALRARFRESLEHPRLLEPGVPAEFCFSMDAIGHRFLVGHRIRVEICSSWFPMFERNLNSGAVNPFRDVSPLSATQVVFHRPDLASHVALPVVRRTE